MARHPDESLSRQLKRKRENPLGGADEARDNILPRSKFTGLNLSSIIVLPRKASVAARKFLAGKEKVTKAEEQKKTKEEPQTSTRYFYDDFLEAGKTVTIASSYDLSVWVRDQALLRGKSVSHEAIVDDPSQPTPAQARALKGVKKTPKTQSKT